MTSSDGGNRRTSGRRCGTAFRRTERREPFTSPDSRATAYLGAVLRHRRLRRPLPRLDPEELREKLTAYQIAVAKEVADKRGYVARFVGDGVPTYFGWPNPDETHAESAVRAGLAIIVAIGAQQLSMRIGIATGLVVTGDLVGSARAGIGR